MPDDLPESYLGDGVYARFDGYQIVLDLRAQDSTTLIYLDPLVLNALLSFAKRCNIPIDPRNL